MCSLDVAFMLATVRNRPREGSMAVPMVSFAKGVIFGGFNGRVASFREVWHFVLCGRHNTLRRFGKMSFRGRRSNLDASIVILRGRRSTLDVSCCVLFANRIVRAASSGDKVQVPWQAWHFVRCDEKLTDAWRETSIWR